jgi:hypothetical protein
MGLLLSLRAKIYDCIVLYRIRILIHILKNTLIPLSIDSQINVKLLFIGTKSVFLCTLS